MDAPQQSPTISHQRPQAGTVPTFTFLVGRDDHGNRIDTFLSARLRNYHSWRFARLATHGQITADDQPVMPSCRVLAGQSVRVVLREPPDKLLDPELGDVTFAYRDPWIAVVNKRPGVVVHPTGPTDTGTLCHHLQHWLDTQTVERGVLRPGIVHRLDRETSGALAVAFEAEAHRGLAEAFEHSRVSKSYLAIVEGLVTANTGVINSPIGRARAGSRVLMTCRGDGVDRKPAVTHYCVLQRFQHAQCSLVRCVPRTGRNHQIRVHLASIGHPLLADPFYRSGGRFHPEGQRPQCPWPIRRHALHAERLAFAHPIGGAWIDITATPPPDLTGVLAVLR